MKKVIIGFAIVASFFLGTRMPYMIPYEYGCDFASKIVDWNTDGTELSILLDNDYEFYAYKGIIND